MTEIRTASAADETAFRNLWEQYLAFYQTTLTPQITDATWARILDPESPLTARLAVTQSGVQGFALHHAHLSTWALGPDCYLEDLFVTDTARGLGLGRALIEDLRGICAAKGYSRLYWHTDQGNTRARALYDSFTPTDGHVRYRMKTGQT